MAPPAVHYGTDAGTTREYPVSMSVQPSPSPVVRPSTRWGLREAAEDAAGLVLAVGALVAAIFLVGTPIALAITLVLRLIGMARGAL